MAVATAPVAGTTPTGTGPDGRARPGRTLNASPTGWIVWAVVAFFFVNLLGLILSVVVSSFSTTWFGTWLPKGFTGHWYSDAWKAFNLSQVLGVTAEVALFVVVVSLLIGVPTAYVLARRDFPGKKVVMVLFLLPVLIPPITYGIPLATVLYKLHLAGTLPGVMVINLVPAVPFVVLTITPFIEQIDPRLESAARMCGASTRAVFTRVLAPLLVPGILAAGVLVLVRTVGMFELTFLAAGPDSNTLVVSLYYSVFAAGIRAQQSVDSMAVIYTASMVVLLVIALRFVNPSQLVTRVKEEATR
jgi:putative spermidine/putrescine transport system permease protein